MSIGKVLEYHLKRGYGSIRDSETGQRLAVYANYIDLIKGDILREGQEVEYDVEKKRGESWAIHVKFSTGQIEANKNALA